MKRDAGTSRLLGRISFVENKQRSVDCMFTPNVKAVAETRNKGCITTHAIGMGVALYNLLYYVALENCYILKLNEA